MSSEQHKVDIQSLSSLSVDPNQMGLNNSNIFGGRKSSFDYVNILKDSDQLPRRDFRNSLDILTSNIGTAKQSNAPLKQIIQLYNDENKVKIQQSGFKPLQIGQVYSQSQEQDPPIRNHMMQSEIPLPQSRIKLETVYNQSKFNYHSYFPHDLAQVLKQREIPLQYVRGLLMVRDQKQIKTTRKLKVQRYLQKRRKKTWNRKICYNCRQKVAQQRLRIKGKFIKKRRAMQILGLTIPIDTALLRQKLYAALKNKDNAQIQQLLKAVKKQKDQNSNGEGDEDDQDDQDEDEDIDEDEEVQEEDEKELGKGKDKDKDKEEIEKELEKKDQMDIQQNEVNDQENQYKNKTLSNLNPNPSEVPPLTNQVADKNHNIQDKDKNLSPVIQSQQQEALNDQNQNKQSQNIKDPKDQQQLSKKKNKSAAPKKTKVIQKQVKGKKTQGRNKKKINNQDQQKQQNIKQIQMKPETKSRNTKSKTNATKSKK